jgi:hypothetical protein
MSAVAIVGRAQMLAWGWTEVELDVLRNMTLSDYWLRKVAAIYAKTGDTTGYEPGPDGIRFRYIDKDFVWPRGTVVAVEQTKEEAARHWCPCHAYDRDPACMGCGGERLVTRSMDAPRATYSEHQAEAERLLAVLLDGAPLPAPPKPVVVTVEAVAGGVEVLVKRKKGAPLPGQRPLF